LKLRLDEMVPVRVARALRAEGFDVDSAGETPDLRGLPDSEQLRRAADEGRAIVSYDAADLLPLAARRAASGAHAGLILLSSRRFPQGDPDEIVASLASLLADPPRQASFVHWLT
jgi:hypothetical protein